MASISEENTTSTETFKKVWDVELFPKPATSQVTLVSKNEKEMLTIEIRDLSNRIVLANLVETNDFIDRIENAKLEDKDYLRLRCSIQKNCKAK